MRPPCLSSCPHPLSTGVAGELQPVGDEHEFRRQVPFDCRACRPELSVRAPATVDAVSVINATVSKKDTPNAQAARDSAPSVEVRFCYITLKLPEGRKVERGYDLIQNRSFDPSIDPAKQSASKA